MLWWRQSWTPFHPTMDSLFYYEVWPECEISNTFKCPLRIALSQCFQFCSYLDRFYLFTFPHVRTWVERMDIIVIVKQDPFSPWEQFRASKNRYHRYHLIEHQNIMIFRIMTLGPGAVMLMQNPGRCPCRFHQCQGAPALTLQVRKAARSFMFSHQMQQIFFSLP